jgi:hypothetical protein
MITCKSLLVTHCDTNEKKTNKKLSHILPVGWAPLSGLLPLFSLCVTEPMTGGRATHDPSPIHRDQFWPGWRGGGIAPSGSFRYSGIALSALANLK